MRAITGCLSRAARKGNRGLEPATTYRRRKRAGGWQLKAERPPELRGEIPEQGWRRLLAFLGRAGASVPFLSAFDLGRNDLAL